MEAVGDNPHSSSEAVAHKTRRGFSLIEAAFVLAVVGAVIGTIWVSAANMYENYKVNKTANDIALIVKNMQSLISISDSERLGLYNLTDAAIKGGVFPKDWLSGSSARTPFFGHNPPFIQNQPNGRFDLSLYDIPKSACIKLVVRVSSIGATAGHGEIGSYGRTSLGYVLVGDVDTGINSPYVTTFPISIDIAASYCKTNNNISFGFGLTRIN